MRFPLPPVFYVLINFCMSTLNEHKKKMGRPSVDSELVRARLHRSTLDKLDAWRGDMTRPEAIRRIIDEKFGGSSDGGD